LRDSIGLFNQGTSFTSEGEARHSGSTYPNYVWLVLFFLCFFDALIAYVFGSLLHKDVEYVNLLPFCVMVILFVNKPILFKFDMLTIIGLGLFAVGYIFSFVLSRADMVSVLLHFGSAFLVFLIGYQTFYFDSDPDRLRKMLLVSSLLYAVVCIIALKQYFPNIFPLIQKWQLRTVGGHAIFRPEIMTDQNAQIFYLAPALCFVFYSQKYVWYFLSIVASAACIYVLAAIQTKSGTLAFTGTFLVAILLDIYYRKRVTIQHFYLVILFCVFLFFIVDVSSIFDDLLWRFEHTSTLHYRKEATIYAIERILDPAWIFPQGLSEYMKLYGMYPHSNLAGFLLDAGLFGLLGWAVLFWVPVFSLGSAIASRTADGITITVFLVAVISLAVQLSSYATTSDQIWLWAGAVAGLRARRKNVMQYDVLHR